MTPAELAAEIRRRAEGRDRFLVAVAGPPGAGKSTLAEAVVRHLGPGARVVPMDGFHYDDRVLEARGHRARKGAPHTFDAAGFRHLLIRLRAGEEAAIPVFDRTVELSRAAADVVAQDDRILVVEGNYLLLDDPPWSDIAPLFDLTVFLDVPMGELKRRLIARWLGHGKSPEAAEAWAMSNDIPNAETVITRSLPADLVLRAGGAD